MSKIKRTLTVTYQSGETVEVTRAKGDKWDDVVVLLKNLFTEFLIKKGYLGELLHPKNDAVWGNLKRLCELLPIAGPDGQTLNLDLLDHEDWESMCQLFFTTTDNVDEEVGCVLPENEDKTFRPCRIAKFHGVDFFEKILLPSVEVSTETFNQKQEALQAKTKALAETEAETNEPIPMKTKQRRTA